MPSNTTYQHISHFLLSLDPSDTRHVHTKNHSMRVSLYGHTHDEIIVGMCHDLIEDSYVTEDTLRFWGVTEEQLDAILLLTRSEDDEYSDYIDRIIASKNALAMAVKVYDIYDHLHPRNIHHRSQNGVRRYIKALKKLSAARAKEGECHANN